MKTNKTLIALTIGTLFISGCSNQESETTIAKQPENEKQVQTALENKEAAEVEKVTVTGSRLADVQTDGGSCEVHEGQSATCLNGSTCNEKAHSTTATT